MKILSKKNKKKSFVNKIIELFFTKGYNVIISIDDTKGKNNEIKGTKLADCPCNVGLSCGALV